MYWKTLCSITALSAGLVVAADHPSFAGSWMLDPQQSRGDAPAWSSMSIAQNGHWFRMAQNDKDGRRIRNFEGECRTDGRFHPIEGGTGGSISCKWDGSALVTQQHWDNDRNRRQIRTTLMPDGKLTQDIQETGSGGSKNMHLVWERR
jgi:hypothetical protein